MTSKKRADSGVEFPHVKKKTADVSLCAGAGDVRGVFSAARDGAGAEASHAPAVKTGLAGHTQREGGCDECIGRAPSGWRSPGHHSSEPN